MRGLGCEGAPQDETAQGGGKGDEMWAGEHVFIQPVATKTRSGPTVGGGNKTSLGPVLGEGLRFVQAQTIELSSPLLRPAKMNLPLLSS